MSIYSKDPRELNNSLAETLKGIPEFKAPEWSFFAKSSVARERPPADDDFWHRRSASILRQLYINHTIGVNKLKIRYGGRLNRGQKPAKFRKGGGKIIRTILQQAETAGLVAKSERGKKGRKLTDKGKSLVEEAAK